MPACRLSIDETPCLNRAFLGVALALDDDPVVLRPLRGFFARVLIADIGEKRFELCVVFELSLDLAEECLCYRPGSREYPNSEFGVVEDVLDGAGKRNYG